MVNAHRCPSLGEAWDLPGSPPSVVVLGIPECWIDARRIAALLRQAPANDNRRGALILRRGE
jgi:hypothetical protein